MPNILKNIHLSLEGFPLPPDLLPNLDATLPSVDCDLSFIHEFSVSIPKPDLKLAIPVPKVNLDALLKKISVPKVDIPKIDVPKVVIPNIDVPNVEITPIKIAKPAVFFHWGFNLDTLRTLRNLYCIDFFKGFFCFSFYKYYEF